MRTRSCYVLLTLLLALFDSQGQTVTLGAIGGTNLTEDVHTGRQVIRSGGSTFTNIVDSGGHNAILGISLEFQLRDKWALEFDALHREITRGGANFFTFPNGRISGNTTPGPGVVLTTWELPLLAKRRFEVGKRQLFVTAGPSFRPAHTGDLSNFGGTIGGGIEFRKGGWRFSPTLRYTRWKQARYDDQQMLGSPRLNQVELLFSVDRPSTTERISAFGKPLSFGFIAGVGLGKDFDPANLASVRVPESNSPIFGAALEVRVHENWSVEIDALYRALHGTDTRIVAGAATRFAHLTWEFPVLAKYRFRSGTKLRPVLEAGPSFRAEGNLNLNRVSHFGATAGVGLERRIGPIRITPMVRYTRWAQGEIGPNSSTRADQVQLLVSLAH